MELLPDKAYHITVAGMIEEIRPAAGEDFGLEEVQGLVEGYIEVVRVNDGQIMIVNEEGKFGKPYNPIASAIAHLNGAMAEAMWCFARPQCFDNKVRFQSRFWRINHNDS